VIVPLLDIAFFGIAVTVVTGAVKMSIDRSRRQRRRARRGRANRYWRSYQTAWDSVFKRSRIRRLTDQRSVEDRSSS
jgi:membrane protein involved in colicin uptake